MIAPGIGILLGKSCLKKWNDPLGRRGNKKKRRFFRRVRQWMGMKAPQILRNLDFLQLNSDLASSSISTANCILHLHLMGILVYHDCFTKCRYWTTRKLKTWWSCQPGQRVVSSIWPLVKQLQTRQGKHIAIGLVVGVRSIGTSTFWVQKKRSPGLLHFHCIMIASINFRVKTAFLEAIGIDQVEEVRNHIFLQSPRLRFSEKLEKVTGPTFV